MEYFAAGSPESVIDADQAAALLDGLLADLGPVRRVLLVPPDGTRLSSGAGVLAAHLFRRLRAGAHVEVLPALGTHAAMTAAELAVLLPGVPAECCHAHDWRRGVVALGEVPADVVRAASDGRLDGAIRCEVNRRLVEDRWDRIISLGQVVPHEVAGLAGHIKNVLIGLGGADLIHKTHFLGAVCGLESLMGRADNPVRTVLAYAADRFLRGLPLVHVLTVRGRDGAGGLVTRGLFAGDDEACFQRAAALCRQVNITALPCPLRKVVVYLDPAEYRSTWLGNKAVYRTRLALADGGELVVLAPGVRCFGEDPAIDALIRRFGYRGTPHTLRMVAEHPALAANLAAAAHLIHGSSEGRFRITYCPGGLTRAEVESVGFAYGELAALRQRYDPQRLRDGVQELPGGEEVLFVSNPGMGLWGVGTRLPARPPGPQE